MANKSKTLLSKAELNITSASFQEAHRLFKTVMKELGELNFDSEMNQRLMIKLISSDAVESALWPCMARATYNKVKVTPDLFNEYEEARSDFQEIASEVLGFNLSPFLKSLSLVSSEAKAGSTEVPKP